MVTRRDKGRKEELEDCFDAWVQCCEEAEAAQEQKSLVEEELKQCVDRHKKQQGSLWRKTQK